ncbi:UbiA prenyltransferase [Paludibacter propionicigenes WB4]|uniref:Protoheme IX farnesyltransferase n=1 Tax=Paludibacter propionicigenes (strain DSM 17365 / JCM 13257 / WB4) TaxID=694427 RepID=E4T0K1_PALPW|nr:protoheme IX farnesyltransferase [Paludibacter propionicigenes]ADQ81065.1 UbiA prenyltransferase [Paludibacter propionicigenes WB4]
MMKNYLQIILALIKYKVSIAVTFTAITGYVVYTGHFDLQIITLVLGVFLLAGGSSALNECQESKYDAKMPRTMNRPIPTGKISLANAVVVSVAFCLAGLFVLYYNFGAITAGLGLLNLVWYNLIYTYLKRVSSFAVVPGSLVGAIPAFMGWAAAGGYVLQPTIIFIAFFLFIWQIPHFWLLMIKYGKEYEEAGFKTINQAVNSGNLKMIIFAWVVATSFSSIIVPLFLVNISLPFFLIIFALNLSFIAIFTRLSFGNVAELNFRKSFVSINVYMMLFMLMLIVFHMVAP